MTTPKKMNDAATEPVNTPSTPLVEIEQMTATGSQWKKVSRELWPKAMAEIIAKAKENPGVSYSWNSLNNCCFRVTWSVPVGADTSAIPVRQSQPVNGTSECSALAKAEQTRRSILRDQFAIAALPEFIRIANSQIPTNRSNEELSQWSAELAYVTADAMLAERDKKNVQVEQISPLEFFNKPKPHKVFVLEWKTNSGEWMPIEPSRSWVPETARSRLIKGEEGEFSILDDTWRVRKIGEA